MGLLPDDLRCAVAVGLSCDSSSGTGGAWDYLCALAGLAEEAGVRLQLFCSPDGLAGLPKLPELAAQGHAVDLAMRLLGGCPVEGIAQARAALQPSGSEGIRAAYAGRLGLQNLPETQQALLQRGIGFSNSDYSTKLPEGKAVGFADKNAAMLIKHTQPRWYQSGLLEIPSAGYSDRDFFETLGRPMGEWTAHLRQCVDFAYDIGGLLYAPSLHLDVLLRHDPEMKTFATLSEHANGKPTGKVGFCTYRQVYEWAQATR